MGTLLRWRLFVRDLISEARPAWGIARMRDCERHGGHRWDGGYHTLGTYMQVCGRCGTARTIKQVYGTGATLTVWPNTTVGC